MKKSTNDIQENATLKINDCVANNKKCLNGDINIAELPNMKLLGMSLKMKRHREKVVLLKLMLKMAQIVSCHFCQ